MRQLMYDDKFENLIEEPLPIWKTKKDIPPQILDFIKNISDSYSIWLIEDEYYCPKCLVKLDNSSYCPKCKKKYSKENNLYIENLKNIKQENNNIYYGCFDVVNNEVILYEICEEISFDNPLTIEAHKWSLIYITKALHIEKEGIHDLTKNNYYTYKHMHEVITKSNSYIDYLNGIYEEKDLHELFYKNINHLYTNNLKDLKPTIYKYTNIWQMANFINNINNTTNDIRLSSLTYYPIYYPQFEYLVKNKMYHLALYDTDKIIFKGSFQKTFGISKKYLPFITENNLSYDEINIIKYTSSSNIELIKYMLDHIFLVHRLLDITNIDLVKLKEYLDIKKLTEHFDEYCDYITYADKLKLNLKDKKVLFPEDLFKQHDKLLQQIYTVTNPKINKKIKELSSALSLNIYETNEYIIYPAHSIDELIDESRQQCNCVRTYCEIYSNNECQIYFMREKENIKKSFVTIEVKNNKITQARTKFNKLPNDKIMKILKEWEKQLLLVYC